MDADALIKVTKAGVKELLTETFDVYIPEAVNVETVVEGKKGGYPDAVSIEENIGKNRIHLVPGLPELPLSATLFTGGDQEVVSCSLKGRFSAVVTDDAALHEKLKALGVSATVPASLVLAIGRRKKLPREKVRRLLDSLSPYISKDEYITHLLMLEGRYPRK